MTPEAADNAAEIRLRPLEWKVLCLLSENTTAKEIAKRLGISEFKVGKTLYGLLSAGLIRQADVEGYVAEEYFEEEG